MFAPGIPVPGISRENWHFSRFPGNQCPGNREIPGNSRDFGDLFNSRFPGNRKSGKNANTKWTQVLTRVAFYLISQSPIGTLVERVAGIGVRVELKPLGFGATRSRAGCVLSWCLCSSCGVCTWSDSPPSNTNLSASLLLAFPALYEQQG